jgi:hypothetical protein
MPEEKKDSQDFGKVIDTLHGKQKLPSLRTYQGDMAEFIKDRNESVVSIALKEKKAKEEKQKEEEAKEAKSSQETDPKTTSSVAPSPASIPTPPRNPIRSKNKMGQNISLAVLSIFLLALGVGAVYFVFTNMSMIPSEEVILPEKIISYNDTVAFSGSTPLELGIEMASAFPTNGVTVVDVAANGRRIEKASDLFSFIGASLPATLSRTLQDDYVIGVLNRDGNITRFIILTVGDFGRAFSGMLEWEASMERDLSFLTTKPAKEETPEIVEEGATSTPSETPAPTDLQDDPDPLFWKDIIVKNKDTRGLVNENGQSKVAYSFLDKNTILIVDNISAIGDLSDIYVSRIVR